MFKLRQELHKFCITQRVALLFVINCDGQGISLTVNIQIQMLKNNYILGSLIVTKQVALFIIFQMLFCLFSVCLNCFVLLSNFDIQGIKLTADLNDYCDTMVDKINHKWVVPQCNRQPCQPSNCHLHVGSSQCYKYNNLSQQQQRNNQFHSA